MKVTYTGVHHDLPAKLQEKVDKKFLKLGKLLDGRGEHRAHVIVKQQRNQVKAEVTVHFHDHQFVGAELDTDLQAALLGALTKLEAQAIKQKDKFREKTRRAQAPKPVAAEKPRASKPAAKTKAAVANGKTSGVKSPANRNPRVNRVSNFGRRKPISLDEAVIEMENGNDYLVYRDVETENLSVLIRRRDGQLDLIET